MNPAVPTRSGLRLLMVTHYFGSHRGGIELVAQRLVEELARLGVAVTWLASDASPPPALPGGASAIPVRAWNGLERRTGLPFPLPLPGEWLRTAREAWRADVVLLHDCLYLTNLVAFVAARARSVPTVIVQHVGLVPYRSAVLRNVMRLANFFVTRPMLARADRVVFISELTRAHFAGLRLRAPALTIFNGVDATTFRPGEWDERAHDRAQLGLRRDGPVIAFVGRFVEKKGVHIVRSLAKCRPQLAFALAGHGPLDPDSWNLPNVRVLRGLSGASLAQLYRAADLLVLPSTGEGFPLVVQEALACGLTVLCGEDTARADSQALPFLRFARVVPGDDKATVAAFAAQLDDAVACVLGSKERAERAQFASSRYSWSAAATQYRDILRELDASRSRPQA